MREIVRRPDSPFLRSGKLWLSEEDGDRPELKPAKNSNFDDLVQYQKCIVCVCVCMIIYTMCVTRIPHMLICLDILGFITITTFCFNFNMNSRKF